MKPQQRQTSGWTWALIMLLSAALQVPLFGLFHQSAALETYVGAQPERRPVKVTMRPQRPRPPTPPEPEPEPVVTGQIVEVVAPEVEPDPPPPEETDYLSNANTRTERQTKAKPERRSRQPRRGARSKRRESRVQSRQSRSLEETATPQVAQVMQIPTETAQAPVDAEGSARPQTDMLRDQRPQALLPTLDQHAAIANIQTLTGSGGGVDALNDVEEEADETVLNSRRFQHWDFFDTLKDRVYERWAPAVLATYRRNDPTGEVYGTRDRYTVIRVTLNPAGRIQRLATVRDSGMDFLDEEARQALRRAGPFQNPPRGLVDDRNQIVFQFGFLFEISTRRFRFFRVNH